MATDPILDQLRQLLAKSDLFPSLASDHRHVLADGCAWFSMPGGAQLFQEGSESDAIFIISTGMLGAYRREGDGSERLLGRMGTGEVVGEIGLITGEVRSATVRALRDSELLRISNRDLQRAALHSPTILTELCRTVVRRLRDSQARQPAPRKSATFTLVPQHAGVDIRSLATQIAARSGAGRDALIVSKELADGRPSDWQSQCERDHKTLVFLAEPIASAWTKSCLRQSDMIVLVAHGATKPAAFAAAGTGDAHMPKDVPTDLVLQWDTGIMPSRTIGWLDLIKPRAHYHVRSSPDNARAARLIAGQSVGLVLSGGGARGLAHLGVMRALSEGGIAVDAIGGVSIGAIIGGMMALEWDVPRAIRAYADEFLKRPHISDFALSRQSLFSGRKARRLIDDWLGETAIEEMPIRFYCASTNLSSGLESVHTSGRLATWVRASFAVPGVFPPVLENGSVHVDGSVLNNLPTDPMRKLGVSAVIAVDLGGENTPAEQAGVPGLLELLWRVGCIGGTASTHLAHKQCDFIITPDVRTIKFLDWNAYQQAIDAGYAATIKQLPDIQKVLKP